MSNDWSTNPRIGNYFVVPGGHALSNSEVIPPNSGFLVDLDGTLELKLRGDSDATLLPVLAGIIYPMDIMLAMTGSTTVTKVYPVHVKQV